MTPNRPRVRPCATCPYRLDAPSGLWSRDEYEKLPRFDGDIPEQVAAGAFADFGCHSDGGESLCSGWVGHRDPTELLAIRLGLARGTIDPVTIDYRTDVPLFESGAAAAAHGLAGIDEPDERTRLAALKLIRAREARSGP